MRQITLLLVLSLGFYCSTSAQSAAKAVYAEIGGPGLASINYDMRFSATQNGAGFRLGVGAFSINGIKAVTVPLGLNYLIGKNKNYFELGAGYTILSVSSSSKSSKKDFNESFGNLTIGYRYAPLKSGLFFKAELTPVFSGNFFIPYFAGLGLGYKF